MVGVAVKVTGAPAQMEGAEAAIVTAGVARGVTAMVIVLLLTEATVKQVALLVRMQLTWSALVRVVEVKVGLLVPTLPPLTRH